MPNFLITLCSENFASLDLLIGADSKTQYEEGTRTNITYSFNGENQLKNPSWLQVVRNYENAIIKLGGKKVFKDNNYATYKVFKNGVDIWVMLTFVNGDDLHVEGYYLDVLEKEPMTQDITANDMYSALSATGSIALYINFETGKSDIKPESQIIIDQITEMMNKNPGLKISVEGHTDNTGTALANQSLSESRAKSIMDALIAKAIDKGRLSSKGWGQTKPIADNTSDQGQAKNRRVEIVRM